MSQRVYEKEGDGELGAGASIWTWLALDQRQNHLF